MPGTPTTRLAIPTLTGTDFINDGPTQINASFAQIDAVTAADDQGVYSSRPVSNVSTPGKRGRYYYATDTAQLWRDTGTGWVPIYNRPLCGHVDSTGAAVAGPGSGAPFGWLSSRSSTGVYGVGFSLGYNHSNWVPTVTPYTSPSPVIAIVSSVDANGMTVETFNLAGTHVNSAFFWSAEAER